MRAPRRALPPLRALAALTALLSLPFAGTWGCSSGGSSPSEFIDIGDNLRTVGWAFGDSISHGRDSLFTYRLQELDDAGPHEPGYRRRLEELFAAEGRAIAMVEDGEPGTTSDSGVLRIGRALHGRPAFLVLLYGTNDSFFGRPLSHFQGNLRFIGEECRKNRTLLVLCTLPPVCGLGDVLPQTDFYNEAIRSLAVELDTRWGGVFLADLDQAFRKRGGRDVCHLLNPGGTHPTQEGYRLIAETVFAQLEHVAW